MTWPLSPLGASVPVPEDHPALLLSSEVRRSQVRAVSTLPSDQLANWVLEERVLSVRAQMMLVSHPHKVVRSSLARSDFLLPCVEELLSRDASNVVRQFLAAHSDILSVLVLLAGDDHSPVAEEVARRSNLAPEVIAVFLEKEDKQVLVRLAANRTQDPVVLALLARKYTQHNFVARHVAGNPSAPPETIQFLATLALPDVPRDSPGDLRLGAAANPSCPPDLLASLCDATDPLSSSGSRQAAAPNPSLPERFQYAFLSEGTTSILQLLASNPALVRPVQDSLAVCANLRVRESLARCSSTHPDVLEFLAGDEEPSVRVYAATNTHLPLEFLCMLATDEEMAVRRRSASSARLPRYYYHSVLRVSELSRQNLQDLLDRYPQAEGLEVLAKNWDGTFVELLEAYALVVTDERS